MNLKKKFAVDYWLCRIFVTKQKAKIAKQIHSNHLLDQLLQYSIWPAEGAGAPT